MFLLAIKRGGVLQVRLTTGHEALVQPEFLEGEDDESEGEPQDANECGDEGFELGSVAESVDLEREDLGERDGSKSRRQVREEDEDWVRCSVVVDAHRGRALASSQREDPERGGG